MLFRSDPPSCAFFICDGHLRFIVRLHAVIGPSKGALASVIMSHEWEKVFLYCDSESGYLDFLEKLGRAAEIENADPVPLECYEFREVPRLDRDAFDKKKLIEGCIDRLTNVEGSGQDDVLFFSGTGTHLAILTSILGIRNVISTRSGSFHIEGPLGQDSVGIEKFELSLAGLLEILGLEIEDGRIKNLGIGEETLCCHYETDFRNGRIILDWGDIGKNTRKAIKERTGKDLAAGTLREDFAIFVRGCDRKAGRSIVHRTTNERMVGWLSRANLGGSPPWESSSNVAEGDV